ncbi:MAG: Fic family protein, partial [Methanoregula sp.]|uniref:Fic family protein n=1 Tax=Methanoregula sp. TaxID=2052170 RepID=UPI003FD71711
TLVEIHVQNVQDKDLIILEVPAGQDPPYAFQNIIYMRTGAETKKADIETIRDLVLRRQVEPERWERRFSLADPDKDLDKEEIKTAINAIAKTGRLQINDQLPNISFLEQLSVFKYGRLTNGGDILFTTNPAIRNPQIRVRTARFTTDKSDDKFTDQKSFEGPLVQLLEDVFGFIQRNTSTSSDFTADSLTRLDIPQYPPDAIREGLVNAFAHRDYSNSSGGVFVNIYRDRLEIENTGKFPEGVTLDSISKGQISVLRNPDIAHVLYLRGFMEKMGRGSVLIQKTCTDRGLPLPQWSQNEQGVRLTFFAFRETHEIPHEINPGIKRMLNVLDGDMSRRELQDILNLKDEGHFRKTYLKPAIQQNLISLTIPKKPYSNKQKYRLTKKGQSLRDQK